MDRRDVARLGHYVVRRRVSLGYRNRTDLADSLPFTVRTLADIEQGVRKANPGTYAMLENKLAWAPGGIDTILAHRRRRAAVAQPTHQLGQRGPRLSRQHRIWPAGLPGVTIRPNSRWAFTGRRPTVHCLIMGTIAVGVAARTPRHRT